MNLINRIKILWHLSNYSYEDLEEFKYRCKLEAEKAKTESLSFPAFEVTNNTYKELQHLKEKFLLYNVPRNTKVALDHILQILKSS